MQQMNLFNDINEFSQKFGLPQPAQPKLLDHIDMHFRMQFMYEELREIQEGYSGKDIEEVFDGLIDLVYVALGTAWLMNLPFNDGWARVHLANMQKERAMSAGDTRSKRGHRWDIVKPEGWEAPVLTDLVE